MRKKTVPNIGLMQAFNRLRENLGSYKFDRFSGYYKRPDGSLTHACARLAPHQLRKGTRNKYFFQTGE